MSKRLIRNLVFVGSLAAAAGLAMAVEPEVVWPTEWTLFGPVKTGTRVWEGAGRPRAILPEFLPGDTLKSIPGKLVISGINYPGQKVKLENGRVDLVPRMGSIDIFFRIAYLLAPVHADADMTVQVAAGAGWFMQWWLDGQPVFDTLDKGNQAYPVTARDHVFKVNLTKGDHVLAVAVLNAPYGSSMLFELAVTAPAALQAQPVTFKEVMQLGRKKCTDRKVGVDFPAARYDFGRALPLATTDVQQAEARLSIADSLLNDIRRETSNTMVEARQEYAAVLALNGATAEQKGAAALGAGETLLRENRCEPARREFARALGASTNADWVATVRFAMARSYIQEKNFAAATAELNRIKALAGLEDYMRFNAQSHLDAISLMPRLCPTHPRLFFNTNTWPAVKARTAAAPETFRKIRDSIGNLPNKFELKNWGGYELPRAALVYRVTGDPALLDKIRKMLRACVDYYYGRREAATDYDSRLGCAAALDWTWNDLPPAERAALARDLLRDLYGMHVEDLLCRDGRKQYSKYNYYYAPSIVIYAALAAFDPDMDPVDYARAMALLGRGYYAHLVEGFPRYAAVSRDGSAVMTELEYCFGHIPAPLWSFMHCWQSALDGKIPDEWTYVGVAPECVLRNLLGIDAQGVRGRGFNFSRSWGGWDAIDTPLLHEYLGQFIHFFGGTHPADAMIAAYLRQRITDAGYVPNPIFSFYGGVEPLYPFLLDLAKVPAKLPADLPLARFYAGNGQVLMSSGFETNSTYALFCCGTDDPDDKRSDASEQLDSGHFTIFKQGYLALDSGTRAQWQSGGLAGVNYVNQSVAHNTMLIHMPDEKMPCEGGNQVQVHGGQRARPGFAKPLAFESDKFFAYAASDATATYHTNKCARMVRQFIYLPPDHFVVFDRVVSKKAEYPKTWLLHTANEPAIQGRDPAAAGQGFRADQEQGRIFCRTLLPADAVLEKIGGPGKEFWAGGRNWPIPADAPYLKDKFGITNAADVQEWMGRWRVEVKPGQPRTDDVFLHLIQVSDQIVEKMVESKVSEKDNQVTLAFNVGPRAYAISLNKTGEVGGHIMIVEGSQAVVDRDLTRKIQPQSGLALQKQAQ